VANRSFGSDGCMLIEKSVNGSVVFVQKWVEKLRRLVIRIDWWKMVKEGRMVNRIWPTEGVRLW